MEKAREFLNIYNNRKDNLWEKVEDVGIKKERMEDALLYLREDEEKGGKTVLDEDELSILHSLVLSIIKG